MLSRLATTAARRLPSTTATTTSTTATSMVRLRQHAWFSAATASSPTVHDLLINITIVDPSGARRKIKGLIGKTLHDACMMAGVDIGPAAPAGKWETRRSDTWLEPTFGEGVTEGFDHVVLTGKAIEAVDHPITPPERDAIVEMWADCEIYDGSRLACCVTLNKKMDNMVVYVPDRVDDVRP